MRLAAAAPFMLPALAGALPALPHSKALLLVTEALLLAAWTGAMKWGTLQDESRRALALICLFVTGYSFSASMLVRDVALHRPPLVPLATATLVTILLLEFRRQGRGPIGPKQDS